MLRTGAYIQFFINITISFHAPHILHQQYTGLDFKGFAGRCVTIIIIIRHRRVPVTAVDGRLGNSPRAL